VHQHHAHPGEKFTAEIKLGAVDKTIALNHIATEIMRFCHARSLAK